LRGEVVLRRASLGVGLGLGLLLLVLALRSVEPAALVRALALTNPWFVLLALLSVGATIAAKALRWRLLFYPKNENLPLGGLVSALLIGQTINLLLPARLGEFARAYLVGETEERQKLLALGTIVVERLAAGVWCFGGTGHGGAPGGGAAANRSATEDTWHIRQTGSTGA